MYAVIQAGGKQYCVEKGATLDIEKLQGHVGDMVTLEEVLLVAQDSGISVGQPLVTGASVNAEIIQHKRGPKLIIFKKIRRHGKRLKKGHRQDLTQVRIKEINCI